MTVLIILVILVALGIIGLNVFSTFDTEHSLAVLLTGLSGAFLLGILIAIPVNRYEVRTAMVEIDAFRATVESARKRELDPLERAAILQSIAKWNQEIAKTKYRNAHDWDLWIPDEIEGIEPIE